MEKVTQHEKLLEYLEQHGEATVRGLITQLWVNHPEKIVEMLRHKGHNIKTVPVEGQKYEKYVYYPEPQMKLSL